MCPAARPFTHPSGGLVKDGSDLQEHSFQTSMVRIKGSIIFFKDAFIFFVVLLIIFIEVKRISGDD